MNVIYKMIRTLTSELCPNFVYPKSYFFVTYNSVQNFTTLGQPLLGEKYVEQKEEYSQK